MVILSRIFEKSLAGGEIDMQDHGYDDKEFKAYCDSENMAVGSLYGIVAWKAWKAAKLQNQDLLSTLLAITNSGPDAMPIKEAFEMAHRAIERATS